MVTDRQKRNWARKQFVRLDNKGNVVNVIKDEGELEIEVPTQKVKLAQEVEVEAEETGFETPDEPVQQSLVKVDKTRFPPTKKQLQSKLRFHKYAPNALILHLTEDNPTHIFDVRGTSVHLIEYVGQVSEDEFVSWLEIPGFWPWFISDDETDADLYHAKRAATDYLLGIMELPDRTIDGELDHKVIDKKMKVAETILKQNQTVKVEKKTTNVVNNFGVMPKQFKKMDTVQIENRIKQLKEHQE